MKLLVIDGNSILNRAFYGIRVLTNTKGFPTNAITGFLNILFKLENDIQPDRIAVAFDLKAPTLRHKMYDGYKATRKGMPEELALQLPKVKEILVAMGISIVECEGYEADDILGTLSSVCAKEGGKCVISTGDRDSFQLVNDNVTVRLAKTKEDILYTPDKIMEEYGVTPLQMIEVKALMGDSSDNIPGVAGIGEKTALSLIQNFGSVDGVYENINSDKITKGVRAKLEAGKDSCYMSKELAIINLSAPVDTDLSHYVKKAPDNNALAAIMTDLEMFTTLKKLGVKPAEIKDDTVATKTESEIPKMPEGILIYKYRDEYYALDDKAKRIDNNSLFEILQNNSPKYTFDLKQAISDCGCDKPCNIISDITLACYLANPDMADNDTEKLCLMYGVKLQDENAEEYGNTLKALCGVLYNRLYDDNSVNVLKDIEIPLANVLVSMERLGIKVNKEGIISFGEMLNAKIEETAGRIYDIAGEKFNIGSPKQLGVILFEKLGLPSGKKTKTGYSTNAETLEALYDKSPMIPLIMEYRSMTKLSGTYVEGLLKVIGEDGRIHSTFKQTETRTGRISSAEPNIQNIPVRTELGRQMRKFFVAKEGYSFVDADYSQIELRVLAHISDDEIMKKAFKDNVDIHTMTASQVFNQPIEWVTKDMRRKAKAVNFGIVYGIGPFSLGKDIGVSMYEAKRYIEGYLQKYSNVDKYMKDIVSSATDTGYVTTLFGRRRYIKELAAKNKVLQALGKRIAMNTPIQGTAADIIKIAMVKVYDRLLKEQLDARLVLQVHDELIIEAKDEIANKVADILKEEMENAVKLSVPLTVDVSIGKTWYDTH